MITKLDWISFTGSRVAQEGDGEAKAMYDALEWLSALDPCVHEFLNVDDTWEWGGGRKPYSTSLKSGDNGIHIYVHPRLSHFLIEVSGRACARLETFRSANIFLWAVAPHLTRIDVACDILCGTDPLEFAAQRSPGRFKSHSEFVSDSGTTAYVGSRTSARYARVYRYNAPHERAHLLRVEHVLKGDDAKSTAYSLIEQGPAAVANALGKAFGWEHVSWDTGSSEEAEIRAYVPERRNGQTLFWLAKTVAPLIVRLHRDGVLDARKFFDEFVIDKIDQYDLP